MGGIGHSTRSIAPSGNVGIDGILGSRVWADTTLRISAPTAADAYAAGYGSGEHAGLIPATEMMIAAMRRSLDIEAGNSADDGFSVEGFTNLTVQDGSDTASHIRIATTDLDPFGYGTAWGYYPSSGPAGGDVWFSNTSYDYSLPIPGNYAHATMVHELGHTLGLEHGHSHGSYGELPPDLDSMEYSVMTYRSFEGSALGTFSNEAWGYAQSWMMLDIAALQHSYGANFTTNADDTVYSWSPYSGETFVNGEVGISPGANRIFATVWDGGGRDLYDLSAYDTPLAVSLAPGDASRFDDAQLVRLGTGEYASGNIYNARLFQDDPRSMIEDANGGSGDDVLTGNRIANRLSGGDGNDRLLGRAGGDSLHGNAGADVLCGQRGSDKLYGGAGNDRLRGDAGYDLLKGGDGDDLLVGGRGNDKLDGGDGRDILRGCDGVDLLTGGDGADLFRFNKISESPAEGGYDLILDFAVGVDRIDLSRMVDAPLVFRGFGDHVGQAPDVILRHVDGDTRVLADLDGDAQSDLRIDLTGMLDLGATDFIL